METEDCGVHCFGAETEGLVEETDDGIKNGLKLMRCLNPIVFNKTRYDSLLHSKKIFYARQNTIA